MPALRTCVGFLPLLVLPACATTMDLPPDFLRLHGNLLKATTPDDARLWVREFADPDAGPLEFWSKVLERDCVQNRGYELVGASDVHDGAGHAGRQFEFRTAADGERYGYLVSLFVLPGSFLPWSHQHVLVAEFTAREAVFTQRLASVRTAIATLEP
jgi:hypothetical protein